MWTTIHPGLRGLAEVDDFDATPKASAQPSIGFWVLAHDKDPTYARAMRQTWLRSEAYVRLCVVQGTPHAGEPGLVTMVLNRKPVPWLDPKAHSSDAEARSLDGLHPRQTHNESMLKARNGFLRAKVFAILLRMCEAPEDFSMILDDDTGVNVTRLRAWLRERAMPLLYGGHVIARQTPMGIFRMVGGGAGIVFSRAALAQLCSKPCLTTCLAHMLGMITTEGQAMGGDSMLGKCARDCHLPPTSIPGFHRSPLWAHRRSANTTITSHHTRPTNRTNSMGRDPRCQVLHVPGKAGRSEGGNTPKSSKLAAAQSDARSARIKILDLELTEFICAASFAVVGAPKSGTTSLFMYLTQNPDIAAPKQKELHVFRPVYAPSRQSDDHYSLLKYSTLPGFPRVAPRDFRITGEASPAYFYHPAAARFFVRSGSLRAILLLRHPVARWLSEFQNRVDQRHEVDGPWQLGSYDFAKHVNATARAYQRCAGERLLMACFGNSSIADWQANNWARPSAVKAGVRAVKAKPAGCACVSPVVSQGWYDVYLPLWLPLGVGQRLHIEMSENFFVEPQAALDRISRFLSLPAHKYATELAFNTNAKRGANSINSGIARRYGHSSKGAAPLCADVVTMHTAQSVYDASVARVRRLLQPHSHQVQVPRSWSQVPDSPPITSCRRVGTEQEAVWSET